MRARSVDTIELWIWSCLLERTGASPASTGEVDGELTKKGVVAVTR